MVSSIEEIKRAKALLEQAKQELRQEKLPFDEGVKLGIMIEIPAVAVIGRSDSAGGRFCVDWHK